MRSLLLAFLLFAGTALADTWVASWAASQQIPEPANSLEPGELTHATLRQIVHLSIGGSAIRVRLSNAFGTEPLHLLAVHVARATSPASPAIDPTTDHALKFAGRDDVTIPAFSEYYSDPLATSVTAGADLVISIYCDEAPAQQTGHPGSRATSYLVRGDLTTAPDLAHAKRFDHWYQLSGVDVETGSENFAIVALGDSITDGHGATTNGNDRWPDAFARRISSAGVLNEGIGGNHLLTDGLGPNALSRFDRDVLGQSAVRYLIVFEGVNDLGGLARTMEASAEAHADLVRRIIAAYQQIIARAHAAHIRVYGATITPYADSGYYHPDAASEADRVAVNTWIKTPGHFDGVIDFDGVVRNPARPDHLLPAYDCGDHLHPSPAGYAAMANAVPLSLFGK